MFNLQQEFASDFIRSRRATDSWERRVRVPKICHRLKHPQVRLRPRVVKIVGYRCYRLWSNLSVSRVLVSIRILVTEHNIAVIVDNWCKSNVY